MNSKGDISRKRIFEVYSKNWELTREFIPDLIIKDGYQVALLCPICLRLFNQEGLRQIYSDALTLEDIPPKRLGGKATILTCKLCNNFSGHKLDSKLLKQRHVNSFLQGDANSQVDVYISIQDGFKTKGKLTIDKKGIFSSLS